MKLNKILLIGPILIMTSFLSFNDAFGQDLEKYKWKNRVLVVKTLDIKSKKYQEQIKQFEDSKNELIDRKFVLYKITGNDFVLIDYGKNQSNSSGKTSGKSIGKVLNELDNFEVILIGLDGGIKRQQTEVLTIDDLFKTVDSMPMRMDELRKKN